jgi:hypothetical protein
MHKFLHSLRYAMVQAHWTQKCQKVANKNVGGKAPLQSLPIISEPFHTVYLDLIGKVELSSADGHTHILTLMDSATHFLIAFLDFKRLWIFGLYRAIQIKLLTYLLAVPLKKTDPVTIAEALMKQFDPVRYSQRIYSDNGSNLSSDIMREIYRTFALQ